ncbi:MAG: sugar phosphate isomerase/epimerase [Armatimonadota bacterium]|nr:sugar phosphate isomerase/epimerase [Armatimonadota bacterium]
MPLAAFPKCFLDDLVVHHTMTVEQWIEAAAQLEIDGLEFYWGFTPHDDEAALRRLRELIESYGLTMPMMCYSPDFIKPDVTERTAEIEKQKRAIEVTAALGGKFCRVLSGQRRTDVSRADGVRLAAECITALLPHAERCGVTLILENHYKDGYWQFPEFAQKMDVFLELLEAIPDSPWFGVNYDPSNAVIAGDDPLALLEAVKHRVVSMHASDRYFEGGTAEDLRRLEADPQMGYAPILKHGVIGRGLNDYDTIFSILKSAGFNGWISIEDGQDPMVGMEHLRLSAEFLRRKMAEHHLD